MINPDTNQTGLFKFKKDIATTDHVSECIAYDLANLIGIPCARFEIGVYNGREGSMSYNIVTHKNEMLIEGIYCISLQYSHFDAETLTDLETGDRYSLEMIKKSLEPFGLFARFLPILVFDFLIGNTDRHQSNWALVKEDDEVRLSPLYDNSSSLCAYIGERKIDQYLGKENYYDQTIDTVTKIESVMTEEVIGVIMNKYKEVLSVKKRSLIINYLLSKKQLLKTVYMGGIL